jgi:hypothetical protein
MKRLYSLAIFISFIGIMFYEGCKDTITADQINNVVIPSSNVSYSQYIQPVLTVYCATSGCHDGTGGGGGISFTTWSNTVADPNVVFPYKPDNSSLVWVITGKVPQHPPLYYNLNANQIQGVKTWISEGAKNN